MPTKNLHNLPSIEILFPIYVNIFITKSQVYNTGSQQAYIETVKKAQVSDNDPKKTDWTDASIYLNKSMWFSAHMQEF